MAPPRFTESDTIRILVATDNHVGYEERDEIRRDDSWKTFDEIMNLARKQDVDMVLLAGDLFHDNKPSRKSMYQVIRSLRKNCLGMKPCALEFLSDANEVFHGAFGHVNYEDADINIAIPVFSIHGNHDDPSGDGNFCSLDLLQVSGLVNYFGRVPEADNIHVKPVLLQKGQTKLALYGLSNVRDERMHRTFRDNKVKWYRPNLQSTDWYNVLAVHQNHVAHSPTSYLPEEFLPEWLDLVVWGHEHECLIDPNRNPATGFHVMQPGSSVATSLIPGEAVPKHVAVVSITGKDFQVEKHRLKTVRPFVTRDLVLSSDKRFAGLEKTQDSRAELTRRLISVVDEMIEEANHQWDLSRDGDEETDDMPVTDDDGNPLRPLPLIRLKVEYSAAEGAGSYDIENPQRFSNRFAGRVANTNDVVYFYRKKTSAKKKLKVEDITDEVREMMGMAQIGELVDEYLTAQSLKIFPQAPFGDAVNQFVTNDDKHAVDQFVEQSLKGQQKQMLLLGKEDPEDLESAMQQVKKTQEQLFIAKGLRNVKKATKTKPRPDTWDSDLDGGHWEDQPEAHHQAEQSTAKSRPAAAKGRPRKATQAESEDEEMPDVAEESPPPKSTGRRKPAARPSAARAPAKKPPAKGRGRGALVFEESDEQGDEVEEADVIDDDDDYDMPPPPPAKGKAATRAQPARSNPPATSQPARSQPVRRTAAGAQSKQSLLSFSQKTSHQPMEISDDEISDDDGFEPIPPKSTRKR